MKDDTLMINKIFVKHRYASEDGHSWISLIVTETSRINIKFHATKIDQLSLNSQLSNFSVSNWFPKYYLFLVSFSFHFHLSSFSFYLFLFLFFTFIIFPPLTPTPTLTLTFCTHLCDLWPSTFSSLFNFSLKSNLSFFFFLQVN